MHQAIRHENELSTKSVESRKSHKGESNGRIWPECCRRPRPERKDENGRGRPPTERPPEVHTREAQGVGTVDRRSGWGEAMAELTLLMPYRLLEAMEKAASSRGLTTGHLLRRLIRNCLAWFQGAQPPEEPAVPNAEASRRGATQREGRRAEHERQQYCHGRRARPRLRHMSKHELPDMLQTNPRNSGQDGAGDSPEGRLRQRVGWVAEVQGRVVGSLIYAVVQPWLARRRGFAPQPDGSFSGGSLGGCRVQPLQVELLDVTVAPAPYWEAVERVLLGRLGGGASVLLRSRPGGAAGEQPGSAAVPSQRPVQGRPSVTGLLRRRGRLLHGPGVALRRARVAAAMWNGEQLEFGEKRRCRWFLKQNSGHGKTERGARHKPPNARGVA